MSIGVSLIKLGNKIFKPVVHPFNLQNSGEKTYAEWQFEKGNDTIKCYDEKYKPYMMFEGKDVLDIGCGAGGKSLYYAKQGANRVVGVDIVESYEKESMALASKLGLSDKFLFLCTSADNLPYPDGSFDTIIMNDAMEHVSNPEAVLKEAMRVLRDDGRIFINFPPYGHPFGQHMSDVINMPYIQFLFSERDCIEAYKELVADKPDGKDRIKFRISTDVHGNDYISYINKMSISRFNGIVAKEKYKMQYYKEIPLRNWLKVLAKIPKVKEAFVKMVVCVLVKDSKPVSDTEKK